MRAIRLTYTNPMDIPYYFDFPYLNSKTYLKKMCDCYSNWYTIFLKVFLGIWF